MGFTLPPNSVPASSVVVGTTTISGGTASGILWNNGGVLAAGPALTSATGGGTFTDTLNVNFNTAAVPAAVTGRFNIQGADGQAASLDQISYAAASALNLYRAAGTGALPTAIAVNNQIGVLQGRGYDGTAWSGGQAIVQFIADENWGVGTHGASLRLIATPIGSATAAETARADGVGLKVASGKQTWLGNALVTGLTPATVVTLLTKSIDLYDVTGNKITVYGS